MEPVELVAGGAAMGRIDGFPIFVRGMFPGDIGRIRLVEIRNGYARGELLRIERPSALRRAAPCPIDGQCGGCDWAALRLDAQLGAKERILAESLRRIGKIHEHPPIAIHPSPLNYRLRSRLHRHGESVGFFAAGSRRVVPLAAECEVVGPETAKHPEEGETWEVEGRLIRGAAEITVRAGAYLYQLSTAAFFQVNRHLLGTLLRLAAERAARVRRKRAALDLYAGVGFFTLPLAALFERVTSVEGSEESCRWARRNAPPNVEVRCQAVERCEFPEADLIFLDPPRAGAARAVIAAAGSRAAEMICYLSCDPVTFSRDANRLIASGWRLATLDLLDLFPNTHHVETLASFERAQ